ncbi:hypothetical protein ACFQOY_13730 [Enterococcus alcedinis]|uniref:Uncharacterized protein n=1 Tax=Enterococcus alcedinis TaxID=1274384 RepID=A0A917N3R8_9ENTE|nr:hypothetical protein [Enterococcus alcedinis]MBP2100972.1 hypothetical protein [Enterococcus alcedinis]GGI64731.1 hypothetical protein GCM10011482_03850 [Enterococcus alcedinis]
MLNTIVSSFTSELSRVLLNLYGIQTDSKEKEFDQEEMEKLSNIILEANVGPLLKEIAIAERINNSEEVEIEEYYSDDKNGLVGVDINQNQISTGLKASKNNITKRVYKFKGINKEIKQLVEHLNNKEEG